jgi:hypothetical protein
MTIRTYFQSFSIFNGEKHKIVISIFYQIEKCGYGKIISPFLHCKFFLSLDIVSGYNYYCL